MLPIRDNVPTRHFPVVTVTLIAANVAVWLFYELPNLDRAVRHLAFHPCEVNGSCPQIDEGWALTALTSMFMHGSWLHLGGNMLFLWIFGNNVEDAMGRVRFLVFYLLGGFAATALQTWVTFHWGQPGDTLIPNLGASGAISAVLGAYILLLPTASVLTIVFYFFVEVPAVLFLGFWIRLPALGRRLLDRPPRGRRRRRLLRPRRRLRCSGSPPSTCSRCARRCGRGS